MIHDPDTSTFNSVDILRRARIILRRHDDKGLGLAPCPSEFVDRNICGHTREYIRYVYYAHTHSYVSVLHLYLKSTTHVAIYVYARSRDQVRPYLYPYLIRSTLTFFCHVS